MSIQVSTIAGCGEYGYQDGKAENAMFKNPLGVCISHDNKIYITDHYNYLIRMISDGIVSTIAGCGKAGWLDGKAEDAMFHGPSAICISNDNKLYVTDHYNNTIIMISDGMATTIAGCGKLGFQDGRAKEAMFFRPTAISISDDGNLFISDTYNHRIRMISDRLVSTIAGSGEKGFQDGKAENAMFNNPTGICISADDNIYVSDFSNNRIRMISDGMVSTIAGCGEQGFRNGKFQDAMFNSPNAICISRNGKIYVSDYSNHRIRMISDGVVSTFAGCGKYGYRDGNAEECCFNDPGGLCISDDDSRLYVLDRGHRIRMISGLPSSSTGYFELSSLLNESKSLSDMTLTINNHQYHLHTAVVHSLCPMIIKHKSIIEDAKISHESLQTMFEMIYSNDTIKIRKQKPNQYEIADLIHLLELIWLFESFEINNRSFVTICIKQFKAEFKHLMKKDTETLHDEIEDTLAKLVALSQSHGLQKTKLVEINHFINQNRENQENDSSKSNNNKIVTISMHDMFLLFGLHTEPRLVDQQQIKSETVLQHFEMKKVPGSQPDYTIMTRDRSYQIKCHKVILYGKWSYFRRMIESGLLESASGEMIMSEDWNATRLYDFVKYLYTHEAGFDTIEDSNWLLHNAELYELMETSSTNSRCPKADFDLLIRACRT